MTAFGPNTDMQMGLKSAARTAAHGPKGVIPPDKKDSDLNFELRSLSPCSLSEFF